MTRCTLLGHRWRFSSAGNTMRWDCERGCGAAGNKTYASAEDATRYARALDHTDSDTLGRRPLLSLLPLGLARRAAKRR
jgi:hypothetical protein